MCLLQSCYLRAGGVCDAKSYPYLEGRNLGQSFLDGTVTRLNLQERKRGSGAVGKRSLNKKMAASVLQRLDAEQVWAQIGLGTARPTEHRVILRC